MLLLGLAVGWGPWAPSWSSQAPLWTLMHPQDVLGCLLGVLVPPGLHQPRRAATSLPWHWVAFEEVSGHQVLIKSGPENRCRSARGTSHMAGLEFPPVLGGKCHNLFEPHLPHLKSGVI